MSESRSLLAGRKGLVVGMANEHSIAYGCARMFRDCGAELAVTWINEKTRGYVEPLPRELAAAITMPLDVDKPGEMEAVFDAIRGRWGRLDFLLHSIAFAAPQDSAWARRGHLARRLCPCDGHLVPLLHTHGTAGRTTDGQRRHAADDDLPRRKPGRAELRRDGTGEGGARSDGALSRDRVWAARDPRQRGFSGTDQDAGGVRHSSFDELFEQARRRAPLTREVEIDDVGSCVRSLSATLRRQSRATFTTLTADSTSSRSPHRRNNDLSMTT